MEDAIPAATLVIFRESVDGPPELLLVERARAMAFAAGALVFPGGRIDPADYVLAASMSGDAEDNAARIAAIRETIEEVGVPIGVVPSPDISVLMALREALHSGSAFGEVLHEAGLTLEPQILVPFARWRPKHAHMRIFDTRFYLAELPADAPTPKVDATENVRLFWATAQQVLDDADAGRAHIIFPTRRNLERLAQFGNFATAVAHAATYPLRIVTPWQEERGGEPYLCIPDDLGYPVTSERLENAMRG